MATALGCLLSIHYPKTPLKGHLVGFHELMLAFDVEVSCLLGCLAKHGRLGKC